MKRWAFPIMVILVFFCTQSVGEQMPGQEKSQYPEENTVLALELLRTRHIGGTVRKGWDVAAPESLVLSSNFNAESASIRRAWIDGMVFEADLDNNPVKVNGVAVGYLPKGPQKWIPFNMTVSPHLIKKGGNNLSIGVVYSSFARMHDNIQLRDVRLFIEYENLAPKIFATKHLSRKITRPGQPINVTVILANTGVRDAFNISAGDQKPPGVYYIGEIAPMGEHIIKKQRHLAGGEIMSFEYFLLSDSPGNFSSETGKWMFQNSLGEVFEGPIESTRFIVLPAMPNITMEKSFVGKDVVGGRIMVFVNVTNHGGSDAFRLRIRDDIPPGYNITDADNIARLDHLKINRSYVMAYNMSAKETGVFHAAAWASWEDSMGYGYQTSSNHLLLMPKSGILDISNGNERNVLAILGFLIIVLFAILIKVRYF